MKTTVTCHAFDLPRRGARFLALAFTPALAFNPAPPEWDTIDDCVRLPVDDRELLARLRTLRSRVGGSVPGTPHSPFGDLGEMLPKHFHENL